MSLRRRLAIDCRTRANISPSWPQPSKRSLQTPQREWLRGPLQSWAEERIEAALERFGGLWLESGAVRSAWKSYCQSESDNSFYVWQWVSLDLTMNVTIKKRIATC